MQKPSAKLSLVKGFTLIEMLTAMAVFMLLSVIVFQIVTETARSSGTGNRRIEATKASRTALDSLGEDIATAVAEYGSNIMTEKDANGNTTFAFLCSSRSEANAQGAPRLGGVFFKVMNREDKSLKATNVPMLCRGFLSVSWQADTSDALNAIFAASNSGSGGDVSIDPLSDMVFRMEAVFIDDEGKIIVTPPYVDNGQNNRIDISKVRGIIIAIAALDKKTQALLLSRNSQAMATLAGKFRPVSGDGKTPMDVWSSVVADLASNAANQKDFPTVAQNVRLFQRTFYVK